MENYGIIGYPLSHSLSPQIHNLAFQTLNIDARYEKIEIKPEHFDNIISQLKSEGWKGFNVTVPFKEKIIPYLDEIEPVTGRIGAVNTVKISGNKWTGYNTDYIGFIRPIEKDLKRIDCALIIGAGGASRAVIYGLLEKTNIKCLYIANRTESRARQLLKSLSYSDEIKIKIIDLAEINSIEQPVDLLVNTTNVGMGSLIEETPVKISKKFINSIVYDLIYNPKKSKLLRLAESLGCRTINGFPMLLYQADESFKIWTGKHFPDKVFRTFLG